MNSGSLKRPDMDKCKSPEAKDLGFPDFVQLILNLEVAEAHQETQKDEHNALILCIGVSSFNLGFLDELSNLKNYSKDVEEAEEGNHNVHGWIQLFI